MAKHLPLDAKDSAPSANTLFKFDTDDNDFEQYKQGFIAKSTAHDTQKCLSLFNEWKKVRNGMLPNNPVPQEILQGGNKVELCKWFSKFATEVRKKDGSPYPLLLFLERCWGVVLSVFIMRNQFDSLHNEGSYGTLA